MILVVASACDSSDVDDLNGDARPVDAALSDGGAIAIDGGTTSGDAAPGDATQPVDGAVGDAAVALDAGGIDSGAPDSGVPPSPEMVPGSHVQLIEGRVAVRDTFAQVTATLGSGQRSAGTASRSYEWLLSGGVELTVWFANSNLDNDDAAPNDVDTSDRVLWIAVQGGFSGATPQGVDLSSNQIQVEGAYGAAPHAVTINNPAGRLAQYFELGLLVAYDQGGAVRTITICRAYPQAPNGGLDPESSRLRFSAGDLQAYTFIGNIPIPNDDQSDAKRLLGDPDGEGDAVISGQSLHVLSYGFIGIEVFSLSNSNDILFFTVHAPYYGTSSGGEGVGSARPAFEAYLNGRGYGSGSVSSGSANFFCYDGGGNDPDVGVSYSTDLQPVVTSIVFPLLQCP